MKRVWLTFALLTSALPTFAYAQGQPRKIEVRATGEVTVSIDDLRLPLELTTSGEVFAKAKDRNDQLLESVQELVDTQELPRFSVESTTASFDFTVREPRRVIPPYAKGNQQSGYSKGNDDPFGEFKSPDPAGAPIKFVRHLALRFNDLTQATDALNELTDWDAVRVSREIQLSPLHAGIKDLIPHQRKARRLAIERAKEKAAELAEASGLQLGAPISVDEVATSHDESGSFLRSDDPFGSGPPRFGPIRRTQEVTGPGDGSAAAQLTVSVGVVVAFEAWRPEYNPPSTLLKSTDSQEGRSN